jgi:hypothetical protein
MRLDLKSDFSHTGTASARRNVLKPDIQRVRTHWIRGFMAFQLARRPEDRFARVV